MTPKVKETLDLILARFESGEIPEAVAYSMFPIPEIPCSAWSLLNRTLVFISGTMDARGIRQWNSINRSVKTDLVIARLKSCKIYANLGVSRNS